MLAGWDRIEGLLPGQPGQHGKAAKDNRLFVDAVLWVAETGAPCRDLPGRFGNWNSAWRRFDRRSNKGVWQRVFEALQDPDREWLVPDSTVIRAHPCAAGAEKKATAAAARPSRRWGAAAAASAPRSTPR
jgi:transposase